MHRQITVPTYSSNYGLYQQWSRGASHLLISNVLSSDMFSHTLSVSLTSFPRLMTALQGLILIRPVLARQRDCGLWFKIGDKGLWLTIDEVFGVIFFSKVRFPLVIGGVCRVKLFWVPASEKSSLSLQSWSSNFCNRKESIVLLLARMCLQTTHDLLRWRRAPLDWVLVVPPVVFPFSLAIVELIFSNWQLWLLFSGIREKKTLLLRHKEEELDWKLFWGIEKSTNFSSPFEESNTSTSLEGFRLIFGKKVK